MKKLREDCFELFLFECLNTFDIDSNINTPFTFQQMYLANLCSQNIHPNEEFSFEKRDAIKRKFFLWQSNTLPRMNWISEKYTEWFKTVDFSHDDDLSWNDMDKFIFNYVVCYVRQVGCETYHDYKRVSWMNSEENKGVF